VAGTAASVWEKDGEQLRWIDAILLEAGVWHTSSLMIVLKREKYEAIETPARRKARTSHLTQKEFTCLEVCCHLAVRQVIETTVTTPNCRVWNLVLGEEFLVSTRGRLANEIAQRSLVKEGCYGPNTPANQEHRSSGIKAIVMNRGPSLGHFAVEQGQLIAAPRQAARAGQT
jgi:hypothetical protein